MLEVLLYCVALWFGIAVAYQSGVLLGVAAAYVAPALWFYIREEERMMSSAFRAAFEEYTRRVGRLLPRLPRLSRLTSR